MICVDLRAGSKNLIPLLPRDLVLPVEQLPAGDVVITDPTGEIIHTAIEHKRINDLLSCIVDGRFAGTQLPALFEHYDSFWLLVEGPYHEGANGELMVESSRGRYYHAHLGSRYFQKSDLDTWLYTMQEMTPLKVKEVQSRSETISWIVNTVYRWWQKGKDRHRSHIALDKSRETVELIKASLVRRWGIELPGIGDVKSYNVDAYFQTGFDMAVADPYEWCRVSGVTEQMAQRIVGQIRGEGGKR